MHELGISLVFFLLRLSLSPRKQRRCRSLRGKPRASMSGELPRMQVLWKKGRATVGDVVGLLSADPPLAYSTAWRRASKQGRRDLHQFCDDNSPQWNLGGDSPGGGDVAFSDIAPTTESNNWACPSYSAEAQLFVSELVTFPPGTGCGKSACPVDKRDVETEYGPDNEAPADERAGNR
jgi:hypothetical protein